MPHKLLLAQREREGGQVCADNLQNQSVSGTRTDSSCRCCREIWNKAPLESRSARLGHQSITAALLLHIPFSNLPVFDVMKFSAQMVAFIKQEANEKAHEILIRGGCTKWSTDFANFVHFFKINVNIFCSVREN